MSNNLVPPALAEISSADGSLPFSRVSTPGMAALQVGFVGLGNIGYAMAKNMAFHGPQHIPGLPPVIVWNRTTSKAQDLVADVGKDKVTIAESVEQVALQCDVIIVNLANDDVVRLIYAKISEALKKEPPTKRKIFVETSTIYPSLAGDLDVILSALPHTSLITCPVLGTPGVAEKSQLLLIMSGEYNSKKTVANLLVPSVGRKVVDLGGDLEKALTYKLMANSLILGTIEVVAEALTFAEKSHIGSERVFDLIKDYFPAPSIMNYAQRMIQDNFDGTHGFAIDGGIKDATHIRRLSAKHNCPMPAIDVAHQHLVSARALYQKDKNEGKATVDVLDWSALVAGARVAAGLSGFDKRNDISVLQEDN